MAKITSPKADESLMYFSRNEKKEKNSLSFSSFFFNRLLENSEIEIISKQVNSFLKKKKVINFSFKSYV